MATPRTGYDPDFLSIPLPAPTLSPDAEGDAPRWHGSPVIRYVHFSLTMSASRRLAHWVAWNVDGARLLKLSRGGLAFRRDSRLGAAQLDDALYRDNPLDRGHLARRADLTWGARAQAAAANRDSFLFPNIAPQMDTFNQSRASGLWGRLEDALYEQVEVDDLRLSVFAGCVLGDNDVVYSGVAIPASYWKVIAWVSGGVLSARAFILTQDLRRLPTLDLEQFRTWQVPLAEVSAQTSVVFPAALRGATSQSAAVPTGRRELASLDEIAW